MSQSAPSGRRHGGEPIPLRHWCYAFWAPCASKKGISALQIKRQTGVTYESALYLMYRIRHAMAGNSIGALDGDVEVDEAYVGGKPRNPSLGAVTMAQVVSGGGEDLDLDSGRVRP